jgi:GC-rich sequence DNA-binding factor
MISERRRLDDEDDLSSFLGSLPTSSPPDDEEVDDLGRLVQHANPSAARRDRRAARSTRRLYRRARSQIAVEEEGYSTDSSLPPSDAADYDRAITKISSGAVSILSDVQAKAFKDPNKGIGKWFGEWRSKWVDSYTGAWGGLGLVGAWEFWVRLEVVGWNPLEVSGYCSCVCVTNIV